MEGKIEAQRREVTCPRHHSSCAAELEGEGGLPDLEASVPGALHAACLCMSDRLQVRPHLPWGQRAMLTWVAGARLPLLLGWWVRGVGGQVPVGNTRREHV